MAHPARRLGSGPSSNLLYRSWTPVTNPLRPRCEVGSLPLAPRSTHSMAMPLAGHRFTVDEYHRMGEAGVFHEDDRVELIDGQVLEMSPMIGGATCRESGLNALFAPLAGRQATVSVQNPVVLGEHEEPQPDFTVLRYRADGYGERHPGTPDVLLVIEVADTSVEADRRTKIPLYARTGIPEAWLVNLPADTIECYREPGAGAGGYASLRTAKRGETLTPLQVPGIKLRVDDILG